MFELPSRLTVATTVAALVGVAAPTVALASRGADDPIGHVRHARGADDAVRTLASRGADDRAGEVRHGRGADDPLGHR